jgi:broad specificity phosphatase PhoE
MLFLVRHGRSRIECGVPAHLWHLDADGIDDVRALGPELPGAAVWYSSPEPKALTTARLLTDGPVGVVPGLREHARRTTEWIEDFETVVRRAFAVPDRSAHPGWEPLAETRRRVVAAAAQICRRHRDRGRDLVLVGHGTAWTLLRAAVRGEEPDLDWWDGLAMPDVVRLPAVGPAP